MPSRMQDALDQIRARAKAALDASSIPTGYDNKAFSPPATGIWCRASIDPAQGSQASMGDPGNNARRHVGTLTLALRYPLDRGDEKLYEAADALASAFTNATGDSLVTYRAPSIRRVGRSGQWWQINVVVPWQADWNG